VLSIAEMISHDMVAAAGRGLLLIPSIFAYKPVPPLDPGEPPSLGYPSRGIATLWSPPPQPQPSALVDLLGRTRALLLQMLEEPLPTVELARRLKVTPTAVSQHLQVLHRRRCSHPRPRPPAGSISPHAYGRSAHHGRKPPRRHKPTFGTWAGRRRLVFARTTSLDLAARRADLRST
jgi:hypothetical protein